MTLLYLFVFLIIGFILLVKGADLLVSGSSSLAKKLAISEIVIGLTVVAFGTSVPELVINIFSSIEGHNDIVFGNIIGSNISNTLLVLGFSGLIFPLTVLKNTKYKEIPFTLLACIILFILVNDSMIFGLKENILSRTDGVIFLLLLIISLIYVFLLSKIKTSSADDINEYSHIKTILFILIGFAGLFAGGKIVVDNAVLIARQLSVSEKLIALTIVAWGSSLPELVTTSIAAYKKRCEIAVGNIVGSNIINIFLVLGISSMIRPAKYDPIFNTDSYILILSTVLLLFFTIFTGKTNRVSRWKPAIFLVAYAIYFAFLLMRK